MWTMCESKIQPTQDRWINPDSVEILKQSVELITNFTKTYVNMSTTA